MKLNQLPNQILEKIFLEVLYDSNIFDILELGLVCKKFNEVIGSSKEIMESFIIDWDTADENKKVMVKSKRKYESMIISEQQELSNYLENFLLNCSTLKDVSLFYCKMKNSEFTRFLQCIAPYIQRIYIEGVEYEQDNVIEPVELAKLQELQVNMVKDIASFMTFFSKASNLEILDCYNYEGNMSVAEIKSVWNVLQSMQKLKSLSLSAKQMFFVPESRFAHFNLTGLRIYGSGQHIEDKQIFLMFLIQQRASLKHLTLNGIIVTRDILQCVLSMSNLSSVNFESSKFIYDGEENYEFRENRSIESLTIMGHNLKFEDQGSERMICEFVTNIMEAKNFRIYKTKLNFEICYTFSQLMKLDELWLFDCEFTPVMIPSLKKHSITQCKADDLIRLLLLNRQLKKIKMPRSMEMNPNYGNVITKLCIDKLEFFEHL